MPRRPRVVIPGVPYHITQRGNNRQPVFFSPDDRLSYLDLLSRHARRSGTRILGYCLMTTSRAPDRRAGTGAVPGEGSAGRAL